jgi:hypothetical protein
MDFKKNFYYYNFVIIKMYMSEKCKECKYPTACKYGAIGVGITLVYSTIKIIPKLYRYVKNKIKGTKKPNQDTTISKV